jgi:hypothetical protein
VMAELHRLAQRWYEEDSVARQKPAEQR